MIRIGVIGCGHWGPNHIRIFTQLSGSEVPVCADLDEKRLANIAGLFPATRTVKDYQEIFKDGNIDAVCISTPTNTHFTIAREALQAGKHVFCEKPLALDPHECLQLGELARESEKVLMVGHIFVFNQGIVKLREYIQSGEVGHIQYAHSERTNLGPFRYDVNALWDLAPHDISIFNFLFDAAPVGVSARGHKALGTSLEDLAFATLEYPDNILVNVHVSWLDPRKVRQITIVGDKRMICWDDLNSEGPVRLYDKSVERTSQFYESYGEFQLLSRVGNITIPNIGFHEPLKMQAQCFLDSVSGNKSPQQADAAKAHDVVKTLVAIQRSIENNGAPEAVE